jgi:dTDP-4-dehydrorhamnose reductase
MRMLITGSGGMLGQDLAAAAGLAGFDAVGLRHAALDIIDQPAVEAAISHSKPDVVVNCAAWTDVDGAEAEFAAAVAVNGTAAGNVARAATAAGAWMVHISSDYVFDGSQREPYVESDPTAPLSAYGRSKLAGETEVAGGAPAAHTIVRSSWLFGTGGSCFPKTILRLATERDQLDVVDDQVGCPTFTGHLAGALVELARRRPPGIVHLAGTGSCSWYEFAQEIVSRSGLDCEVRPVPSTAMPRPAPRPAYSVLGTERAAEISLLPSWAEGLEEFMSSTVGSR